MVLFIIFSTYTLNGVYFEEVKDLAIVDED